MNERLVIIKTNNNMNLCNACGFTYLPIGEKYKTKCPKCETVKIDDEVYLKYETKTVESVSSEDLFENFPTYKELV